jgi:hypothetical protein
VREERRLGSPAEGCLRKIAAPSARMDALASYRERRLWFG